MGPYPPRVALALFLSPRQSAIGRWDWGFHTVRGGVNPGDHRFRPGVVGVVDVMERFLNLGSGPILPGCDGIVRFSRGATSAARAAPTHWPRARGQGGGSANGIGSRKTLG